LRLRRVAAFAPQALDALTKLTDAVLGFSNPIGNSEKCNTVLGHLSTL
jgi:hypothetical protein